MRPLVFAGDSTTELWSEHRPAFFPAHGFANRGVGGETSRQIRLRFRSDVVAAAARGVHLLCGINDIAENEGPVSDDAIRDNVRAMVAEARGLGIPVWLGSILPCARVPWNPEIRPAPRVASLNAWLRAFATEQGAVYVDYFAVLGTETGDLRAGLGEDGLHLSADGYAAIEPVLLSAL